MAVGKKRTARPSTFNSTLNSMWQDKHLILFKPEYTLLVAAVLWCVEIGINVWVIQKVACKLANRLMDSACGVFIHGDLTYEL